MNAFTTALILVLISSCTATVKLTPEMESLRQSLNQRLRHTSCTSSSAMAFTDASNPLMIIDSKDVDLEVYNTKITENGKIRVHCQQNINSEINNKHGFSTRLIVNTSIYESSLADVESVFSDDIGIKMSEAVNKYHINGRESVSGYKISAFECKIESTGWKLLNFTGNEPLAFGVTPETAAVSYSRTEIEEMAKDLRTLSDYYRSHSKKMPSKVREWQALPAPTPYVPASN